MGTDLGKVMKMQRLSEEKIQYLVYQMLKGLKVTWIVHFLQMYFLMVLVIKRPSVLLMQYIHSAGIIHRVSCFLCLFVEMYGTFVNI